MTPFEELALKRPRLSLVKRWRRFRIGTVCLLAAVILVLTSSLPVAVCNRGSAMTTVLDVDETVVDGLTLSRQDVCIVGSDNSSPWRSGDLHDHELVRTNPTTASLHDSVVFGETRSYVLDVGWRYEGLLAMSSRPCVGAYTELWRLNWYGGHDIIAASFTGSDGRVAYGGLTAGDYAVAIWVDDCRVLNIRPVDYDTYSWWTGWFYVSGSVARTYWIDDENRGVWEFYHNVRDEHEWLLDRTGYERGHITVQWPVDMLSVPNTMFKPILDAILVIPNAVPANDHIWKRDIAIHEYAHAIHYSTTHVVNLGRWLTVGPVDHYLDTETTQWLARMEGWAEFMVFAVDNNPTYIENLNWADTHDQGDWDGNIIEGAVAEVFWDIFDGVSTIDYPSWDASAYGDFINQEFMKLWNTFIVYDPESIDDVWTHWTPKTTDAWAVFYHARVNKDFTPPSNPTQFAGGPPTGIWTNSNVVSISLLGASDDLSGIWGYEYYWTTDSHMDPDGRSWSTSSQLPVSTLHDGYWYLSVRSRDRALNEPSIYCYNPQPWKIDITAPWNPNDYYSSHTPGVLSDDDTIWITWSGAGDSLSGIQGYSIVWDNSPLTTPDMTVDTSATSSTSAPLPDGSWYFHVRSNDNAGNWASGALHVGPFLIGVEQHHPVAVISGDTSGLTGESLSYDGTASYDTDGTVVTFSWNFGDGSFSSLSIVEHYWSEAGVYTVTLTVTDDDGLTGWTSISVAISDPGSGDTYEPDNDYTIATELIPEVIQNHSIHGDGADVDWLYFVLSVTSDVVVETSGEFIGDTVVYLFDSIGVPDVPIASDDDGGQDLWSRIALIAVVPGTYYVKIVEFGMNNDISQYSVSLIAEPTNFPPDPGDTSSLSLVCGTESFSSISESGKSLTVSPGQILTGNLTMLAMNTWAPSAAMVLIGTTSWGVNSESHWTVGYPYIGESYHVSAGISLTVPSTPGVYFLIFAFRAEMSGANVASATNWACGSPVWDDGNDIADFDASQVSAAQLLGRAPVNWLLETGYEALNVPADVIILTVMPSGPPLLTLTTSTDRTHYASGEVVEVTMALHNSGGEAATLVFSTSCQAYFIVTDSEGSLVYDLHMHMIIIFVYTELTIGPGESVEFHFEWDLLDDFGCPLTLPTQLEVTGIITGYFESSTQIEYNPSPTMFTLNLEPGWNLVTIPILNDSIMAGNLPLETGDIVAAWDAISQSYESEYVVGISPATYDFYLVCGESYQIWVSSPREVTILGCSPEVMESISFEVDVDEMGGWVSVGLSTTDDELHASDLASFVTGANVLYICRWNSTSFQYEDYVVGVSPSEYDFALVPGEGYWIWVDGDCAITYCP